MPNNPRIKVVKREDRGRKRVRDKTAPAAPAPAGEASRKAASTVASWISELREKRQAEARVARRLPSQLP